MAEDKRIRPDKQDKHLKLRKLDEISTDTLIQELFDRFDHVVISAIQVETKDARKFLVEYQGLDDVCESLCEMLIARINAEYYLDEPDGDT